MKEELVKPLGLKKKRKLPPKGRRTAAVAAAVVLVAAAGAAAWWFVPGAKGPTATAVIAQPAKPAAPAAVLDETASLPPPGQGLTEISTPADNLSGVGNSNKVTIIDPSAPPPMQLASLPDPSLVESSDKGPLPRVGSDGRRPLEAYARPAGDASSGDVRIAIVVGGLGLDPAGTKQAIAELPGPVTLAFAPYGDHLADDTAAARQSGHELLLQIPEEPFNYPKTNPGPNTLTTDATADVNKSRLRWFLGRMTNYVGVTNYMGARFSGEQNALAPVMQEVAGRGLLYLDDGSSLRSKAADIAGSAMPFLRADLVLDADLSADAIDANLKQLKAIARDRGYAIATATAFPLTLDRVAVFAAAAAQNGIELVPVTALLPPPA
jgi:polysaccharide deacetylase 2 family uncharacterized protein YibQ